MGDLVSQIWISLDLEINLCQPKHEGYTSSTIPNIPKLHLWIYHVSYESLTKCLSLLTTCKCRSH